MEVVSSQRYRHHHNTCRRGISVEDLEKSFNSKVMKRGLAVRPDKFPGLSDTKSAELNRCAQALNYTKVFGRQLLEMSDPGDSPAGQQRRMQDERHHPETTPWRLF